MSHQIQGARAGLINLPWDKQFMDDLINEPEVLQYKPHLEYMVEKPAPKASSSSCG